MGELKPCPFCGKSMLTIEFNDRSPNLFPFSAHVLCLNCLASVGSHGFEQTQHEAELKARAAWNRRAAPENKARRESAPEPAENGSATRFSRGGNKPLTLEQLKRMNADMVNRPWVWIEASAELFDSKLVGSAYYQVQYGYDRDKAFCFGYPGVSYCLDYADYGKTWLAYAHSLENAS